MRERVQGDVDVKLQHIGLLEGGMKPHTKERRAEADTCPVLHMRASLLPASMIQCILFAHSLLVCSLFI